MKQKTKPLFRPKMCLRNRNINVYINFFHFFQLFSLLDNSKAPEPIGILLLSVYLASAKLEQKSIFGYTRYASKTTFSNHTCFCDHSVS